MKMVNNKIIKCLAALLIGAAGTAFAGTSCGTNMEYEIVGTELRLTSPDPTSPATINSQAFINRTDFTEISMPDNVTVINTKAFEGCTALTSVVIPPSVTEIGVEAFKGCTNLHSVLCRPQTPPALLGTDGFTNCHESLQICVSALGLYKAATNWSNYADKILNVSNGIIVYDLIKREESKISVRSARRDVSIRSPCRSTYRR